MGVAGLLFGWSPEQFWRSTAHEFWANFEAHEEINKPADTAGH